MNIHQHPLISAETWFTGGERVSYDPVQKTILPTTDTTIQSLRVFERIDGNHYPTDGRWITMLPGFPDGSYGYAGVNSYLPAVLPPRLYIEYVGQGDSDKPARYHYSTFERADLVEAQWRAHHVKKTFVVTFDYSSLVALELLSRQLEHQQQGRPLATIIERVFMVNGGLFADAHSHPAQSTPLLKSALGVPAMWFAQRSRFIFERIMRTAALFSPAYAVTSAELREEYDAITRRNGAAFLHNGAGFVDEHQRHAERWDLARLYDALTPSVSFSIAGSREDPYEPKQIETARARLGAKGLSISMFPGGHLLTSEHPDLLAETIREQSIAWMRMSTTSPSDN